MKIVSKDSRNLLEENRFADVVLAAGVTVGFAPVFCAAANAVYKQKKTDRWFTAVVEGDDYVPKKLGKSVVWPGEWLDKMTSLWQ
jgi:lipopolysaccharide/colanic/teichoic acid biosynthesis glycosyltransferase